MAVLLVFCTTLTATDAKHIIRINHGYILDESEGKFCAETATADLHFVLTLPTMLENATLEDRFHCGAVAGESRAILLACRQSRPLLNALLFLKQGLTAVTRLELTRIYDMLQSFEHEESGNNNTQQRGTRGILTSIGGFLGGALGLASESHVNEIAQTMKHIYDITYKSAKTLDMTGQKISKVIQTQNERLDLLNSILRDEHNLSQAIYDRFNQQSINFDMTSQIIANSLGYMSDHIAHLDNINSMKNSLHQLILGELTDELVSREILSSEIKALQNQLGTTLTVCHLDTSYYYKMNTVRAFRTADQLIITVPVPLSHYSDKFTAVRIIPIPMPSHMRETGYIQMTVDRNTLLYTMNAGVYTELDTFPNIHTGIASLPGKTFHILHPNKINSCEEAILFNKHDRQKELCNFHYWQGKTPNEIMIRTDETHALVAGISQVKLTCSGQEDQIIRVSQASAMIKVDCNCDISTENLLLPAVSSSCSLNKPRIPRVVYNYNSFLLKSLFDEEKLNAISELQLHEAPLEVDIPPLQIVRMQEKLDMDSQRSIKLHELTDNIVNSTKIYGDLSSYVYDKVVNKMLSDSQGQSEFSVFNYQSWLLIIALTLASISCGYSVYLTLKLRAIGVLILAGSRMAQAQNDGLIRPLRLTPRPTVVGPTLFSSGESILGNLTYRTLVSITDQHLSDGMLLVLIWLTLLFIAITLLYYIGRKPKFGPLTDIFLRINSAAEEVTLSWDRLRFAPGSYRIKQAKPLGRIRLNRLRLTFDTKITFVEKQMRHENKLVESRLISPWEQKKLRRIMAQEYTIAIIVTNTNRTITQIIHETVGRQTKLDTVRYTKRRAGIELPEPTTSHETKPTEVRSESTTVLLTADKQTETEPENRMPPPPPSGLGLYQGVGRGAFMRQFLRN